MVSFCIYLLLLLFCMMDYARAFHINPFSFTHQYRFNTGFTSIAKNKQSNIMKKMRIQQRKEPSVSSPSLQMGLFDAFFQSRQNDFVKLDPSSQDTIGPGPLILLYNIPHGIDNEEISGMIGDGAPIACASGDGGKGVAFVRIYPQDIREGHLKDKSVLEALESAMPSATYTSTATSISGMEMKVVDPSLSPIIYFSGISNSEMMQTYNIIAGEIYQETGGAANAACAKVVEPAFGKSFGQLVEEISGDHNDAIGASSSAADDEEEN